MADPPTNETVMHLRILEKEEHLDLSDSFWTTVEVELLSLANEPRRVLNVECVVSTTARELMSAVLNELEVHDYPEHNFYFLLFDHLSGLKHYCEDTDFIAMLTTHNEWQHFARSSLGWYADTSAPMVSLHLKPQCLLDSPELLSKGALKFITHSALLNYQKGLNTVKPNIAIALAVVQLRLEYTPEEDDIEELDLKSELKYLMPPMHRKLITPKLISDMVTQWKNISWSGRRLRRLILSVLQTTHSFGAYFYEKVGVAECISSGSALLTSATLSISPRFLQAFTDKNVLLCAPLTQVRFSQPTPTYIMVQLSTMVSDELDMSSISWPTALHSLTSVDSTVKMWREEGLGAFDSEISQDAMVSVDDPEAFHPESVVATFVLHTKYAQRIADDIKRIEASFETQAPPSVHSTDDWFESQKTPKDDPCLDPVLGDSSVFSE
eukprot:TRINITY_DN4193_c0_g1_i1.p1 TRINITY_DN4193_c0_g1~~TRINITY_DN4193_c0_g1_i1.p1  ORF type:complete len:439 (-),score=63.50 TRINITY_DN4193_c0_g1_i1:11-1327(-)